MSEYDLTPPATVPSVAVQEAREKRRRVLEAVRQRRKILYTLFHRKMQEQSQFTA